MTASAARALSESRRAIAALTKPLDEPLEVALAEAARETADREGTTLDLVLTPGIELDYRRRDALIRIACEATANAARHGGAAPRARRAASTGDGAFVFGSATTGAASIRRPCPARGRASA